MDRQGGWSRRGFLRVAAGVSAPFILPRGLPSARAQAKAGTLRVIPYADLRIIDPIWTTSGITEHHGYMIYDTLFAMDAGYRPKPQMVESYEVAGDGLTYSFILRPGLKWHDGAPVTARDCVASIRRWGGRDTSGQALMARTGSLEAKDERTFVLVLKQPYGLVLSSLAKVTSSVLFIMPERVALTPPATQITESIGSGPFKFLREEWVPGGKAVYVRNEDYVPRSEPADMLAGGKIARVERVEFSYVPDGASAMAALIAGEFDFYEAPQVALLAMAEGNPDVKVEALAPLGMQVALRPNALFPPFDNIKARQALLNLVDQGEYMTAMVGDPRLWRSCGSIFGCGTPNETTAGKVKLGHKNLDLARQLLQDGGYKGEPVVIMDPTDHPTHPAALLTAANLRKIGATVDLQAMDWATLTSRRASKNPPTQGGWSIFHTRLTGEEASSPLNNEAVAFCDHAWYGWPCDRESEKLEEAWFGESRPAKAKAILDELHSRLVEFVPYVPVGQYAMPSAYRASLKGVLKTPNIVMWNVAKA